jgi:hypothetical protein
VDNIAAIAIQDTAQVVKRPTKVEAGNIHMPVLLRTQGLHKSRPLLRRLVIPTTQKTRLAEHSPYTGGAHRHRIGIQHHKSQPATPLQGMIQVKSDNGLLLLFLQPKVPGNPPVMLVDFPVAVGPAIHEIHHRIPRIRRHPSAL